MASTGLTKSGGGQIRTDDLEVMRATGLLHPALLQAVILTVPSRSNKRGVSHPEHFQPPQSCLTCSVLGDSTDPSKERPLQTRDGTVTLAEPAFHCPTCQRAFSPQRSALQLDGCSYSPRVLESRLTWLLLCTETIVRGRWVALQLDDPEATFSHLHADFRFRPRGRISLCCGPRGESILQVRAASLSDDDRLAAHLRGRPGNPFHPNARPKQTSLATAS